MQKKTAADWIMPSIADVLFLSFFFQLLRAGSSLLDDGDTGWHIVTGANILKTFRVPYSDPYSHTMAGATWTAHEWLAEVIFALFWRLMGLNGVVLLAAIVIILTFFLLYLFMLRSGTNAVIAVSFTILAACASMLHWLARPHIFSLPLTLAFIVILERYQRQKVNHLKLLPLLMVLWVNVHGGYILGLVFVFLYAGGNLLRAYTAQTGREEAKRMFKSLGITAGITLLATFINPRGPAILYFPFHLVGREFIVDNVLEWLSPNFHQYRLLELILLLFIAAFVLSKRKPDLIEGAIGLLMTAMALYSVRYVPLFVITVTPFAGARAGKALENIAQSLTSIRIVEVGADILKKISANVFELEGRFRSHFWIYVVIGACTLIALNGGNFGSEKLMDYRHNGDRFPVEALDFALRNQITGNMFNNDGWGGYIIYQSYPRYKVFMDGRSDMYGVSLLQEYLKVSGAHIGFEEVLDKYDVTWVLHNANAPICQLLAATGKWKLVYADTTANILLKDTPENRDLIERYKGTDFLPKDESE
jgi:hypothetical protein